MVADRALTVAHTILAQLGGPRFIAMTGARNFVGADRSLSFMLPRIAANGANRCTITLDPSDTYTLTFSWFRGVNNTPKGRETMVYADRLVAVFEHATGLYCSL
jgi:hypothetical protein